MEAKKLGVALMMLLFFTVAMAASNNGEDPITGVFTNNLCRRLCALSCVDEVGITNFDCAGKCDQVCDSSPAPADAPSIAEPSETEMM